MFDGRETVAPLNNGQTFFANLITDLTHQATDATLTHAQATQPPTRGQLPQHRRVRDGLVYRASARSARGPASLPAGRRAAPSTLQTSTTIPESMIRWARTPTGKAFQCRGHDAVCAVGECARRGDDGDADDRTDAARRAIAAGEAIFDSAPVQITNVRGLNDNAALGKPSILCRNLHQLPRYARCR